MRDDAVDQSELAAIEDTTTEVRSSATYRVVRDNSIIRYSQGATIVYATTEAVGGRGYRVAQGCRVARDDATRNSQSAFVEEEGIGIRLAVFEAQTRDID